MLEERYGHHHPRDYQANAVNPLSRPRKKFERLNATKGEQRAENIVKLHGNR